MDANGYSGKLHEKLGVYYLGFKMSDPSVLESMRRIFDNVKTGIWLNRPQNADVLRVKFNGNFKFVNLWSVKIDHHEVRRLFDTFEGFTKDHAEQLRAVRVTFNELKCEQLANGKIRVSLSLCPVSIEIMRVLQNDVIARFEEFPNPDFTQPFNLHCCILSLNTKTPFEEVKKVVSKCSSEVKSLEALLGPFMLTCYRRILCQYPELPRATTDVPDDVPEWVPRSLCVFGFPKGDASEIFQAIARWSSFDLYDDAIERCYRETEYYEKPRIVVVFKDKPPLRDAFYTNFMKRLSLSGGKVWANEFVKEHSSKLKVGVYKAMSRERDRVFFRAEEICWKDLRNLYRPRVDENLNLHLQQLSAPYRQHYFNTQDELDELVDLLKRGNTTEYLTSVW